MLTDSTDCNPVLVAEGTVSSGKQTQATTIIDPYEHLQKARKAGIALQTLFLNKQDVYEITAVLELKKQIAGELEQAVLGANSILRTGNGTLQGVNDLIKSNNEIRDKQAAELKLKPEELTIDILVSKQEDAAGDEETIRNLQKLIDILDDREALALLYYAPMFVELAEAEMRANGFLDPTCSPAQNSELKRALADLRKLKPASQEEIRLFGKGKEIQHALDLYTATENAIALMYLEKQHAHGERIADQLNHAQEDEQKTEHLQKAVELADSLDVAFLASEAVKPENLLSGLAFEIVEIVRMGSRARLMMAEHLALKGEHSEALKCLSMVKADSPELLYQAEATGEISYRQYYDGQTYEKLDRAITFCLPAEIKESLIVGEYRRHILEKIEKANQELDEQISCLTDQKLSLDTVDGFTDETRMHAFRIDLQIAALNDTKKKRKDFLAQRVQETNTPDIDKCNYQWLLRKKRGVAIKGEQPSDRTLLAWTKSLLNKLIASLAKILRLDMQISHKPYVMPSICTHVTLRDAFFDERPLSGQPGSKGLFFDYSTGKQYQ